MLYFADARWWAWHAKAQWPKGHKLPLGLSALEVQARFACFPGDKVTIENTGMMVADPTIHMLHNHSAAGVGVSGNGGLSEVPNALCTGSNGGYQAVNLATLAGAAKVLLLGYDMRFPAGRSHWHGGHPVRTAEDLYSTYARSFQSMLPKLTKMGCEVVNCTPDSAIRCFRFSTLEAELGA